MDVRLTLAQHDPDTMVSLWQWLDNLPRVHRHGDLRWENGAQDGQMGDPFEIIMVLVGSGLSVAQLVVAVLDWRSSLREPQPEIVIERGPVTFTVSGALDDETLAKVIAAVNAKPLDDDD